MDSETLLDRPVMIVDDQAANVRLLEKILQRTGYSRVCGQTDPVAALGHLPKCAPDLVLLDLHMPKMSGLEMLARLRESAPGVPVLVLTADMTSETRNAALSAGAKDFVTKPFDTVEVLLRVRCLLETRVLHCRLEEQNRRLEARVSERTRELEEARTEALELLGRASEYRDDDTGRHTVRVGETAARLAAEMGLPRDECELIRRAAPLHDVGKIAVPDAVLLKPGKLTPDEFRVIQAHATTGGRILAGARSPVLQLAERIALTHHENWDGSGYPNGLAGEQIPIAGRVVALADVFDALTHDRPYKKSWDREAAVAEIVRLSGSKFDPAVVAAFLRLGQEPGA